nr:uncharacterized protein LOC129385891 [Dermacentor andersoni]
MQGQERFVAFASMLLKWCAIGCFFLSFDCRVANTSTRRSKALCLTLLELAYTVCNLATSSACASQALILSQDMKAEPIADTLKTLDIFTHCVLSILLIITPFSSVFIRWRQATASYLIWGAHSIQLASAVTDILLTTCLVVSLREPSLHTNAIFILPGIAHNLLG